MPRESVRQIEIDHNVRGLRVYPVEGTDRTMAELKTVGMKLSKGQAIQLARVLLVAAQDWDEMEITAYRQPRQSDSTHQITVTSNR